MQKHFAKPAERVTERGGCLELNGTKHHVHLLAKLRPDSALSDVLRELKANATEWMHEVFRELKTFHGDEGMARSRLVNQTWSR